MDLLNGRQKFPGKVLPVIVFAMATGMMVRDAFGGDSGMMVRNVFEENSGNALTATFSRDSGILMNAETTQGFGRDIDSGSSDNSFDENPDVPDLDLDLDLNLESVLYDLENRHTVMIGIIGLQRELIDFASVNAPVAFRSRIPRNTCLEVLDEGFCDAMIASFGTGVSIPWAGFSESDDLQNGNNLE